MRMANAAHRFAVEPPAHGNVIPERHGFFQLSPATNYKRLDIFTYRPRTEAQPAGGDCYYHAHAGHDAPVASNDTYNRVLGAVLTFFARPACWPMTRPE